MPARFALGVLNDGLCDGMFASTRGLAFGVQKAGVTSQDLRGATIGVRLPPNIDPNNFDAGTHCVGQKVSERPRKGGTLMV
ncbi:MAG: hypothetical protein VX589_08035 [Myxococcota bacterium]|nr:hypothetical protein [Myxococcota bacterium]